MARTSLDQVPSEKLEEVANSYNAKTVDDFFAAIGYGAISAQQVLGKLEVVADVDDVRLPQVAPPSTKAGRGARARSGRSADAFQQVLPSDPR